MTQILDDCVKKDNNFDPTSSKGSSVINLSILCSDQMINDQTVLIYPLLDCATAKRCSDTDCMDMDISVVNNENNVLSYINTWIASEKFNNILNL